MKDILVVSVGRSDFGIYIPIIRALQDQPALSPRLAIAGAHLVDRAWHAIEEAGFRPDEKIDMLLASDSPEAVAKSIALGTIGFSSSYARRRPDLLMVLGDRFEMWSAAIAALPFGIPIVHIHGGEITEGAIDDVIRHSLTKMSHVHFVATSEFRNRLLQMGEEEWRIVVSGAPGLDNVHSVVLMDSDELSRDLGIPLGRPPILITFHPVTLEHEHAAQQVGALLEALEACDAPLLFSAPNADVEHTTIRNALETFVADHHNAHLFENLGTRRYFSLMAVAAAMVGNSSSGIIEAASFKLPVVNIGSRQEGRPRPANVIDAAPVASTIRGAIQRACSPEFRSTLDGLTNPYGEGHAAAVIAEHLANLEVTEKLRRKRFVDIDVGGGRNMTTRGVHAGG